MKPDKASGPDNTNVNILQKCLDLDIPLSIIFNSSLQTSYIPQDWRDSNVTPIHKKGSRQKCNNYRPVSLTSQIAKLMERLVLDQLSALVKANGTISCHQHGFQSGCSCTTQLIECLRYWIDNLDKGLETDAIYLDFSKAFDTVPHIRLIHKSKQAGVRGKVLSWIEGFLSGRRQRVQIRGGTSSWQDVKVASPKEVSWVLFSSSYI